MDAEQSVFLVHVNIPQIIAHFKNHPFYGVLSLGVTGNRELNQELISVRADTVGDRSATIQRKPGFTLDALPAPGTVEFQQERILKDFIPGVV